MQCPYPATAALAPRKPLRKTGSAHGRTHCRALSGNSGARPSQTAAQNGLRLQQNPMQCPYPRAEVLTPRLAKRAPLTAEPVAEPYPATAALASGKPLRKTGSAHGRTHCRALSGNSGARPSQTAAQNGLRLQQNPLQRPYPATAELASGKPLHKTSFAHGRTRCYGALIQDPRRQTPRQDAPSSRLWVGDSR